MGNYEMGGEQVVSLGDVTNSLLQKARQPCQVLYFIEVKICECLCPAGILTPVGCLDIPVTPHSLALTCSVPGRFTLP